MSARRFEADSTPAAFEAVRAALGDNAFILSNRRIGDRVEVIASRDAEAGAPDEDVRPGASTDTANDENAGAARVTRVTFDTVSDVAADSSRHALPDHAGSLLPTLDAVDARLRRMEVALWGERDDARARSLSHLLQLGLGANTARRLVESAVGSTHDEILREVLAGLARELPFASRPLDEHGLPRTPVTVLVGPDGDARRELLLQFAQRARDVGAGGSIVLLAADIETPGAFESLEAAAQTIGCIAVRVRPGESLASRLAALQGTATVLVDAGERWPERHDDTARWLVLPATLQRSAACAEVAKAVGEGADGCAVTRLDAAGRPGECLDALLEHWLPIVCWNDGRAPSRPPRAADGPLLVAAAVAGARRLGELPHDRALAELLHPPTSASDSPGVAPSGRVALCADPEAITAAVIAPAHATGGR